MKLKTGSWLIGERFSGQAKWDQERGFLWIILFSLSMFIISCAVPRHAGVLSESRLKGGGFVDISQDYQGHYLRVTDKPHRAGMRGGQADHRHSFHHTHKFELNEAKEGFSHLGTSNSRASSRTHRHAVESHAQKPTLTDPHVNEYSYVNWGLYQKKKFGFTIPLGSIVGYLGEVVPPGWTAMGGMKEIYIRVATEGQRGQVHSIDTKHRHGVVHEHPYRVYKSEISSGTAKMGFQPHDHGQRAVVPIVHGHHIADTEYQGDEFSNEYSPRLSYFKMKFIRADDDHSTIPQGVVLLYFGGRIPHGWRRLGALAAESAVGTFLMAADVNEASKVQGFPESHAHGYAHQHSLKSGTSLETDTRKARSGGNRPLSLPSHTHEYVVQLNKRTAMAHHLPSYVEVQLILKTSGR